MAANHRERIVLEHNRLDQKILSELKHENAPMHPTLDALFANGHATLKWFDGEPTYPVIHDLVSQCVTDAKTWRAKRQWATPGRGLRVWLAANKS